MVIESRGGKIGPTAVGELAEIGGDMADGAVGEINGEAAGCVEAAVLRATVIQGSRSPVQESSPAKTIGK